jgi:hypothetical protein
MIRGPADQLGVRSIYHSAAIKSALEWILREDSEASAFWVDGQLIDSMAAPFISGKRIEVLNFYAGQHYKNQVCTRVLA